MSKRVFFSFHYQDVIDFRANAVRNHWLTKSDRSAAGYFDASVWEEFKRKGEKSLKSLINGALENTSSTCVLVGSATFERPWVRYEMLKSFVRGNKIIAVHINCIKGKDQKTKSLGENPLSYVGVTYSKDGKIGTLWEKIEGQWVRYEKVDGTSTFSTSVPEHLRGGGYNLSRFFEIYDWVADDGYINFSSWV